jgi:hypothetical protein
MKPPSKFQIMRVNRGFTEYVNEKQRLVAEIDCCEMNVLRTLRKGELEEAYPAALRVQKEAAKEPVAVDTFLPMQPHDGDQGVPPSPPSGPGWLTRMFSFSLRAGV